MSQTKYFNFNHEVNRVSFEEHDNGSVTFTYGNETADFESVLEFAEFYAMSRNVIPEALKNWTLIEDGNTYAFAPRSASGAVDITPDNIAAIANGLRMAGLSEESIASTIASIVNESAAEATADSAPTEAPANRYTGTEARVYDHLQAKIEEDPAFEFILKSSNDDNIPALVERIADAVDEDEDEDYDYGLVDAVADVVAEAAKNLRETYGPVPTRLAALIDHDRLDLVVDGAIDVAKKFFANAISGRPTTEVHNVTVDNNIVDVVSKLMAQGELPAADKLAFEDGQIVAIIVRK